METGSQDQQTSGNGCTLKPARVSPFLDGRLKKFSLCFLIILSCVSPEVNGQTQVTTLEAFPPSMTYTGAYGFTSPDPTTACQSVSQNFNQPTGTWSATTCSFPPGYLSGAYLCSYSGDAHYPPSSTNLLCFGTCPAGSRFSDSTGMCERPVQNACVYPLVNSITGCVCNAPNYLVNGVCTVPVFCTPPQEPVNGVCQYVCPVDSLPKPPPPFDDACSQALEDHVRNIRDPAVCPDFNVAYNDKLASCVAGKIKDALGNSYSYNGPTATYRTDAYQQHLYDIWARAVQLDLIKMFASPEIAQACVDSQVNKDVQEEIRHHGNLIKPTKTAGSHGDSRAIDIPNRVVDAMKEKVTTYNVTATIIKGKPHIARTVIYDIQNYMNTPTLNPLSPCFNLPDIQWGGRFGDPVHFQFKK